MLTQIFPLRQAAVGFFLESLRIVIRLAFPPSLITGATETCNIHYFGRTSLVTKRPVDTKKRASFVFCQSPLSGREVRKFAKCGISSDKGNLHIPKPADTGIFMFLFFFVRLWRSHTQPILTSITARRRPLQIPVHRWRFYWFQFFQLFVSVHRRPITFSAGFQRSIRCSRTPLYCLTSPHPLGIACQSRLLLWLQVF